MGGMLLSDLYNLDYVFYEQVLVQVKCIDEVMGCFFDEYIQCFVVVVVLVVKVYGLICIDGIVFSDDGLCMFVMQNDLLMK